MRKKSIILAVLGTLFLSAGCRGATDPDEGLTEREARNLMPNFLAASWRSMEKHLADYAADPNRAPGAFVHVEACPQGGEIRIDGTVTVEVEPGTGDRIIGMNAAKSPVNCTFIEESRTYVLSGTTPLSVTGSGRIAGTTPGSAEVGEAGSFNWQTGTRGGTCPVDLAATIDTRERIGLLIGTACRRVLNDSIAWPALAGS